MARAVLFHGPDRPLELVHADGPEPRGAELRVRILCCTLCSSDLHTHAGRRREPTPTVLGHEILGRIEAFGPDAPRRDLRGQPLEAGARITWSVAASCGGCFFCADGLPQKCARLFKYGHVQVTRAEPFAGGLADCILLRPGAAAVRAAGGALAGKSILILGAGLLGLTAAAMAHAAGAHAVLVCDPDAARRQRALAFGATHAVSDETEVLAGAIASASAGRGADVVLEFAGVPAAVTAALEHARIGATVVLAGTVRPTAPVAVEPERIVRRQLTIRGVHNYAPVDLASALDFLAGPARTYPFSSLIGPSFPLEAADAAFEHAHAHPGTRVVVTP
jgi:threonine dehydrogenase-like Zn-dependent dehydrogenase